MSVSVRPRTSEVQNGLPADHGLGLVGSKQLVLEVVVDGVDPALTGSVLRKAEGLLEALPCSVYLVGTVLEELISSC